MDKIPTSGVTSSNMIRSGRALSVFLNYPPDRFLAVYDIGCGMGNFLRQLSEKGYKNLSGVEANDYGIKEFDIKPCNFSYEQLPFEKETFDVLTAWEVFEHLENPYHLIREARRVLKPDGLLILSMPNIFHIMNKLRFLLKGDFIRWTEKNDHRSVFTNKIFRKSFLRDFNLVERKFYVSSCTQMPIKNGNKRLKILLNSFLPENQWFGYFVVYVLRKK